MTYIKLEDVQKQIIEICSCWNPIIEKELLQSINSLPTINLDDYRKRKIVCGDPFPPRNR